MAETEPDIAKELKEARRRIGQLERELAEVKTSLAWRITLPGRLVWRFFNSIPNRMASLKPLTPSEKKRINRFFAQAKGGFFAAGSRDLRREIAKKKQKPALINACSIHLATLLIDRPARSEHKEALKLIDRLLKQPHSSTERRKANLLQLSALLKLGHHPDARKMVARLGRKSPHHSDLHLIGANAFAASLSPDSAREKADCDNERLERINQALHLTSRLRIARLQEDQPLSLDNISCRSQPLSDLSLPQVSVIIPVHNGEAHLETSVRSILEQTWPNLEIIIVDDASADGTPSILQRLQDATSRLRILRLETNSGPYVARNHGLQLASGEFVTCQDADDWSHPERIERQVNNLRNDQTLVANVSHWARATDDLLFQRRLMSTTVIHFNSSSIMFRRQPILERIGFWDNVKFGGDTEFWHRIRTAFGEAATAELPEFLAIGRIREDSLTRRNGSEYSSAKVGARKAYLHGYTWWHAKNPKNLFVPFPLEKRPFGAPARMLPKPKSRTPDKVYDVILLSDFRHLGGNTASNVQELLAQNKFGLTSAIVQVDRYDFPVDRPIHSDIQALVDSGAVDVAVAGDRVKARLAVIRFPAVFNERQVALPRITAENVRVVVNQPPRRVAGDPPFYSIEACRKNIEAYLGTPGEWVPIGPAVRNALKADHEDHYLSSENWFNIIDVDSWQSHRSGWKDTVPVIGRHGRDNFEKWLTKPDELLAAYPADGSMKVKIMGGAEIPAKILGRIPKTWEVLGFNEKTPAEFLADLDFFVFFPHEERIEAFGRTIIEAMASGCLVILPPVFSELFDEAAIYCTPHDTASVIMRFYQDRAAFDAQIKKADSIVRSRFGFEQHVERIQKINTLQRACSG